jgi:hypothetical protein
MFFWVKESELPVEASAVAVKKLRSDTKKSERMD